MEAKPEHLDEKTEFTPASTDDLITKLKEHHIWEQTNTENDGHTPIVWTDIKAEKLFKQFKKGERKFFETPEGFQTELYLVRAEVLYDDPTSGDTYFLDTPHWKTEERVLDDLDRVVSTKTIDRGQKSDPPGVGGKLDNDKKNTPEAALEGEMLEETGLKSDQYDIDPYEVKTQERQDSKGFPKLKSIYNITLKRIHVKQNGYQSSYVEIGDPVRKGAREEVEIQTFYWKKKEKTP